MRVRDLMTPEAFHCTTSATLEEAAHVMWDHDCGFVPIIDPGAGELAGVLTDRDACMAAYTQGASLADIPVIRVMATNPVTCMPDEDVLQAVDRMRKTQVHRLPVVTPQGRLVGVLALNDVVLAASNGPSSDRSPLGRHVVDALAGIGRHRPPAKT